MTSAGRLRLLMKLVKVKQDEPNLTTDIADKTTLYQVKNDEKSQLLPTGKFHKTYSIFYFILYFINIINMFMGLNIFYNTFITMITIISCIFILN